MSTDKDQERGRYPLHGASTPSREPPAPDLLKVNEFTRKLEKEAKELKTPNLLALLRSYFRTLHQAGIHRDPLEPTERNTLLKRIVLDEWHRRRKEEQSDD